MQNTNDMSTERGDKYGDFTEQSEISQNIKAAVRNSPNWNNLSADKKESLEAIAMKMSRILNGDPEYDDSWVDIVGYVNLVIRRLK